MDVHQSGLWSSGCMLCAYEKQSNPKCFMDLTKDVVELLKKDAERITFLETALDFATAMAKGVKQDDRT